MLPGGHEDLKSAIKALKNGATTAVKLVGAAFERIEFLNPKCGALSDILYEHAMAEARTIDNRRDSGQELPELAGIPIVVKEIIDTTPAKCSSGLPFLSEYRPSKDANVVRRLRKNGAVVLGVSTTDPGAFGVRTAQVTHAQALNITVGGSSGGSAAALSAGFCFAALGTDTGGSIRIPSACCLTAGLMPSYGRVKMDGIRPLVWSLDHVGPMTRFARDISLVQQVIDPGFLRTTRKGLPASPIVGYDPDYYQDADPEVKAGIEKAISVCKQIGTSVRKVSLPTPAEIIEIHAIIFCSEAAAYHFEAFPNRLSEYPEVAKSLLELSNDQKGYEYVQAVRQRQEFSRRVQKLFEEVDFLILPTLPVIPPRRDADKVIVGGISREFTLALVRYTCLFDHTGNPVTSIPVSIVSPGLGTSVQIVGPINRDADTVEFAVSLERALDLSIDFEVRL